MPTQSIQPLLADADVGVSQQRTSHYLNGQFRTLEDLNDLEAFLLHAQQTHDELKSNLVKSTAFVDFLILQTRSSAENYLLSAQELALVRHLLADELSELSRELISSWSVEEDRKPTLLEDLESFHRNLKELESVKGYVHVIDHALRLSGLAVKEISDASEVAMTVVSQYQHLQAFVKNISHLVHDIEDGSGSKSLLLVAFLENLLDKTWLDIKDILSRRLVLTAEKLGWPSPKDYKEFPVGDRKQFESAFLDLLRLQSIGEKINYDLSSNRSEKDGLYPLQALVDPISLRFKYHFEGIHQTNRLDKPEWYFTHVLNVAHDHHAFMDVVIQDLLSTTEQRDFNAWREFVLLLLPLISRKLRKTVPILLQSPPLLAHTIYQALTFDASLVEEGFSLQGTSASLNENAKWDGTSDVVLGKADWFEAWLAGEKKFVRDEYHAITSSVDAWMVADNDEDSEMNALFGSRSTNSARRLKALVEQVTDRYSNLPHSVQQVRFLTSIQLPILDSYHDRISSSLDAFEALSSAFIRAVPGALTVGLGAKEESGHVDAGDLKTGMEAVQRLYKALLSAIYIESACKSWGEDQFFMELWADMNRNSLHSDRVEASSLLPTLASRDSEFFSRHTIFEVVMQKYEKLINRAKEMVVRQICGEVEGALKDHLTHMTTESGDDLAFSRTLLAPTALLSSHLKQLCNTLPHSMFTALYRRIASRLAEHIFHRQIMYRGHFDLQTAKHIRAECELWVEVCHSTLNNNLGGGRQRVEGPWRKVLQAVRLISAEGEAWRRVISAIFGTQADEEWERVMLDVTGLMEMNRTDVGDVLKRRTDASL